MMQRFHAIMSEITIRLAMVFESWSFWHSEKVKLPKQEYVLDWDTIRNLQKQHNYNMQQFNSFLSDEHKKTIN